MHEVLDQRPARRCRTEAASRSELHSRRVVLEVSCSVVVSQWGRASEVPTVGSGAWRPALLPMPMLICTNHSGP